MPDVSSLESHAQDAAATEVIGRAGRVFVPRFVFQFVYQLKL
jgi:hypothetical protein